jgi:hypothetical protein
MQGYLRPCSITLEEVFEIMLNLAIESVLFLSIVIIVQFIVVSDCVNVENQFRLKISVIPRVWKFWSRLPSRLSLRGLWSIFVEKGGE